MLVKRVVSLAAVLAIACFGELAWSQNAAPQITVQPESTNVSVGQAFWVNIVVSSQSGGAQVSLPPGSAFEQLSRGGVRSSFSFSSGFGRGSQTSHRESVRWQVRALRPGRQTFGPLVVQLGGQQYRGGSTVIQVAAGGAIVPSPQPGVPGTTPTPQPGQVQPGQVQPGQVQPGQIQQNPSGLPGQIEATELQGTAVYDNELFLRTVLEPSEVYVGQQVVMTTYIYTTLNLANVNVTREASTDGFWSEDLLGPTRRLQFEAQFVGQRSFRVAVLRRAALFPLRDGTLTVGPISMEVTTAFGGFFSRRGSTVARQGVPVQLRVRPLPTEGRPDSFDRGNVGRFSVASRVDRAVAKVGEPVTLTVTVRGQGHLRKVKLPPIGDIEGARVYEPRINDAVRHQGGKLGGARHWEYLIMPQKAGQLEIPALELAYFDPTSGSYVTKQSKAKVVTVTGRAAATPSAAANGDAEQPTAVSPQPGTEEIPPLHLIRRQSALASAAAPIYARWWFVLLAVLAPLAFVVLLVVQRVQRHRMATRGVVRSRRAAQVADKSLAAVAGGKSEDGLAQVMRAINEFFLGRYGQSATGLTMDELRAFLEEQGVTAEVAQQAAEVMERCERGRFAGGGDGEAVAADVAKAARELVAALDRAPKAGEK